MEDNISSGNLEGSMGFEGKTNLMKDFVSMSYSHSVLGIMSKFNVRNILIRKYPPQGCPYSVI